jgi:heterodisulfide reductase subunit D
MSEPLVWTKEHIDSLFAEQVTAHTENFFTCISCGSCTASCPTADRMAVSPHLLSRMIRTGLREEVLDSRSYWLCTSCDSCTVHCPRGISTLQTMIGLKSYAVGHDRQVPDDLQVLRATLKTTRNISGDPREDRLLWSRNLPKPLSGLDRKKNADVVYFVGCVASFYPRAFSVPQAFGRILEKAGISFTTMGTDEWCCGYPLMNAGLTGEAEELMEHNVRRVRELGARRLVTTCPSCYYSWKKLYPSLGSLPPDLAVMHATQLLAELVNDGRITPRKTMQVATYHDPCDLGRKSGETEAPRFLLNSIPGLELREMANMKEYAVCCGGGGDVKIFSHQTTLGVARRRLHQAIAIDADTIVSACQQCKRALIGAMELMRHPMKVIDVTELLWESVRDTE